MNPFSVQDENVSFLVLSKVSFTKISSQLIDSYVLCLIIHKSYNVDQVVLKVISIYLDALMQYIKFLTNYKKHIVIC